MSLDKNLDYWEYRARRYEKLLREIAHQCWIVQYDEDASKDVVRFANKIFNLSLQEDVKKTYYL